ncbi:MAG: molybdopterin-binding protein [Aliidongia sp.]
MSVNSAPAPKSVTACLVVIGNEILSGRTQDANLNYLAKGLNEVGVRLREARGDPRRARDDRRHDQRGPGQYDYVFTTGGIGPDP